VVVSDFVCTVAREEGSGEEHRYAGALLKEKRAFESLIATKEHMVTLPRCIFLLASTVSHVAALCYR
jgi:hypothetical protein